MASSVTSTAPIPPVVSLRREHISNRRRFWRAFARNRIALVGLVIIILMALAALLAPVIAPYDPIEPHYSDRLQAPSAKFLLGTDELGRDLLSRLMYGARISLVIGIVAQAVSMTIGIFLGMVSGWFGWMVDDLIMRITDIFYAIPGLMFLIVWVTIFEPNPVSIFLALGLISWPSNARMMRSQVLSIKETDYVMAAKALGAGAPHMLWHHVLPNAIGPMIVLASLGVAGAILSESVLSFLGLGIQIPTPSWGTMVESGRAHITTSWWYSIFPGLVIMITVLGFNFLGDGLLDAMQPRHYNR